MSWEDATQNIVVWFYHMTPAILTLIPGLVLAFWARSRLKSAIQEGSPPVPAPGITGGQIVARILQTNGIVDVTVLSSTGPLATFYDQKCRTLRLSAPVFDGQSSALVAVAAHVAGHVLQPRWFSVVRTLLTFATSLGVIAAWLILGSGFLLDYGFLAQIGSLIYSASVFIACAILPMEIDANRRVRQSMVGIDLGGVGNSPAFDQDLIAASYSPIAALFPMFDRSVKSR